MKCFPCKSESKKKISQHQAKSNSQKKISSCHNKPKSGASGRTRPSQPQLIGTNPSPHSLSLSVTSSGSKSPSFPTGQKQNQLCIFTLAELKMATQNFSPSNMLGEGGFGSVYKGTLRDTKNGSSKLDVAIKQLDSRGGQGHKEWQTEIQHLKHVNHPNLVNLIGYCVEDDDRGMQMLLVYEFMPKISLERHLFMKDLPTISWQTRLKIALGVAEGLLYLHEGLDNQVILRDLKPSNILLDNDYTPKLSDFGLAREGPEGDQTHVSTKVVGTRGYAAPEYLQTGHLSASSDVWSFGIVLLELLTGRRAVDTNLPRNERYLITWSKLFLGNPKTLQKIMDPRLTGKYDLDVAQRIASLACQCTSKTAKSRPKMNAIVKVLKEIVPSSQ